MDRELRLSELAYGTEKAKALFRDMMQQASYEFGFEADDIPLMIEAIPISAECLVLVITKVEDPDELDTRFSKFSSSSMDVSEYSDEDEDDDIFPEDMLACLDPLNELSTQDESVVTNTETTHEGEETEETVVKEINVPVNLYKVFSFRSLTEVIHMSSMLVGSYYGENTLYKDSLNQKYYLTLYKSSHTPEEYNKACNLISEYGVPVKSTYATVNYFEEHFETIVKRDAIQILSVM